MLSVDQLQSVLTKLPNPSINRCHYRSIDYDALTSANPLQPLWSLGPGKNGQRFTPKGGPPALYVAEKPSTSYCEATGISASLFEDPDFQPIPSPTITLAIQVRLEHILDLTLQENLVALGTDLEELDCPWKLLLLDNQPVPTHILATAAYDSQRFQGIRYLSNKNENEVNLVIWTSKVVSPSFIEVHDPSGKLWQRIPELI